MSLTAFTGNAEDILTQLETDSGTGLTGAEARVRLEKYGENKLKEKKKKTVFQRFFAQFADVMIIILLVAAAVSFVLALMGILRGDEGADYKEFFEPGLILLIVVLNAVLGVVQESKAEKALEALKSMSAPHARVLRDGHDAVVNASEVVPGDIIRLEAGDYVPADARLIAANSLKSEESALTGESVPAEKDAKYYIEPGVDPKSVSVGDRHNMLHSGCAVTAGTATAVVTATGMQTEMGHIAGLLAGERDGKTPLQKKLNSLGKYLGIVAVLACAVVFIIGKFVNQMAWLEIVMIAVALAVSAIPEGLPAIVTIVLAMGVQRMAKKNAIVKKLPAVETLGSASVICSDKTGTLTQNRMTLVKGYVVGEEESEDISDNNSRAVKKMLSYAALCSDGSVNVSDITGENEYIGDPTETAIIKAAKDNGTDKNVLDKRYRRVAEIPFDSDRKLMTTVHKIDKKFVVIVKGAYDRLEHVCSAGVAPKVRDMCDFMSSQALRVLGIAYKTYDKLPQAVTPENLETELTLMGLVGMIDPPRPEAKEAVRVCREAGIKPVMITGDHIITASAVAHDIGILREGEDVMTGARLDALSDAEFAEKVANVSVYARVSPENKIRIVKAWQQHGEIVSMTGDGVNDAPALKAADIGCAMGITGTEVSKESADMILTDDNFATIVDAVRDGRGIYDNIKKVVSFLLGSNIGEIFTVLAAMILFHATPLLSMQLLWINLVTDSFPAIALGVERVDKDIMRRRPKPKSEGLFAGGLWVKLVFMGVMFTAITVGAFYLGYCWQDGMRFDWLAVPSSGGGNLKAAQTMAFIVLSVSQIVHAFNMRSDRSLFVSNPFGNHFLDGASLLSAGLMAVVVFTPVGIAFGVIALSWQMYLSALALSVVPILVMELLKLAALPLRRKKYNRMK
ncbi:MAG: cation-translocating P-type ATPase [Clostridiales bacterium]|jgi:Ca2+-transporting ATPase|nr:cation-translocating P-type ATPase [Clostridiales bacterium]